MGITLYIATHKDKKKYMQIFPTSFRECMNESPSRGLENIQSRPKH